MEEKLNRLLLIISFFVILICPLSAQEVGTAADTPSEYHVDLNVSYHYFSRSFELAGAKEKIRSEIYRTALRFRPNENFALYGFVGSSGFPNSYTSTGKQLYFGGGLKYMLIGEVDIEEEDGKNLNIKGGIGLDFQISRLHSSGKNAYDSFGVTEYQGAIDFGLRVFQFAGYFGFKLSKAAGNFTLIDNREIDVNGRGIFSMFLGFNYHLGRHFALTSECSFFTERYWSLGVRFGL